MSALAVAALMAFVVQDAEKPPFLDFSDPEVRKIVEGAKINPKLRLESYVFANATDGSTESIQLKSAYSIEHQGTVWTTRDYTGNRNRKVTDAPKAKMLWRIDCDNRTSTLTMWVEYDKIGNVTNSHALPTYEQSLTPIVPDSVGETKLVTVCVNFER
ncbi:surface-adhesin E family protein [Sphingomonas aerolata]|uniref:surface-adhesin E family protein n=1 Tax=Sphingomonas aerolata TaxID=185951 RepID=UPI002FE12FA4